MEILLRSYCFDEAAERDFRTFVRALGAFTGAGVTVSRQLEPHEGFDGALMERLTRCDVFMPLLNEDFVLSENVRDDCLNELKAAIRMEKPTVPIILVAPDGKKPPRRSLRGTLYSKVIAAAFRKKNDEADLALFGKYLFALKGLRFTVPGKPLTEQLSEKEEEAKNAVYAAICGKWKNDLPKAEAEDERRIFEKLLSDLDADERTEEEDLLQFLDLLQEREEPDYDMLCRAVQQFTVHRDAAACCLLTGMLRRGTAGILAWDADISYVGCEGGANPYEELFYYLAVYPFLTQYFPKAELQSSVEEELFVFKELVKEARALCSPYASSRLKIAYNRRERYRERYRSVSNMEDASENGRNRSRGYVRTGDKNDSVSPLEFVCCKGLTAIWISARVEHLYGRTFDKCGGIETVVMDPDNVKFRCAGNCVIDRKSKTVVVGCRNSVIPADGSVTAIGENAFFGRRGLKQIEIPGSVVTIGERAFRCCGDLERVTIPDSVRLVDRAAFAECAKLTEIHFGAGVRKIGEWALASCPSIERITVDERNAHYLCINGCLIEIAKKLLIAGSCGSRIPEDGSVAGICSNAFFGRSGLFDVVIPEGVVSINTGAFENCADVRRFSLPASLVNVSAGAFKGCPALEEISVDENNPAYMRSGSCLIGRSGGVLIAGCKNSVFPTDGSVKEIGDHAFSGCTDLTEAVIPEGTQVIGKYAFENCTALHFLKIADSVNVISRDAFSGCASLKTINIPKDVLSIDNGTFCTCTALEVLTVDPENLCFSGGGNCVTDKLDGILISGCKSSVIPSDGSVKMIGVEAFNKCAGLRKITIPEGVGQIDDHAFFGCADLESVVLPRSLKQIRFGAFYGCTALKTVFYRGSREEWSDINFYIMNFAVTTADITFNYTGD